MNHFHIPFKTIVLLLLFLYVRSGLSIRITCHAIWGRPVLADCRAALARIPTSDNPVFFGPEAGIPATVVVPFTIPSSTSLPPLYPPVISLSATPPRFVPTMESRLQASITNGPRLAALKTNLSKPGSCKITINSSARMSISWTSIRNIADIIINGPGGRRLGCVKVRGVGGMGRVCKFSCSVIPFDPSQARQIKQGAKRHKAGC